MKNFKSNAKNGRSYATNTEKIPQAITSKNVAKNKILKN